MELSGIIFVALAVAWAAYLIPKALRHHDDVVRSRSVDRFSHTMRVLARREPVNRKDARLVVTPARATSMPAVETKAHAVAEPVPSSEPEPALFTRSSTRTATRRRRRVLAVLLLANLAVVGVAATGRIAWVWEAIPAALVVLWLIACRLMVKKERRVRVSPHVEGPEDLRVAKVEADRQEDIEPGIEPDVEPHVAEVDVDLDADSETASVPVVSAGDPELWDPVPMTLPTYVNKPAAVRRGVRTIALDDTGVWTSGRTEGDAMIAREAEQAAQADKADKASGRKGDGQAVGS